MEITARTWKAAAKKMRAERDELYSKDLDNFVELLINANDIVRLNNGLAELRSENLRLRELIKQVEWVEILPLYTWTGNTFERTRICIHCKRTKNDDHSPSCPAFGDNGIVKALQRAVERGGRTEDVYVYRDSGVKGYSDEGN